ncbi:Anditomin synthesis protein L [Cladobotryum mycophilum]|uniref:Anditomin synthesis protein L n=1 Tax=Cladobotryum mycophilum TaxID=491253 RepID=A0ABR0T333_9HYPO
MPSLPGLGNLGSFVFPREGQRFSRDYEDDEEVNERACLIGRGRTRVKRFFDGFVDFAFQGNILQIAFGLIPQRRKRIHRRSKVLCQRHPHAPLSILLPLNKNIEEKFAVLRPGPNFNSTGYNTLKQAQQDGAVVMAYGAFIYQSVSFFMAGFALYGLAHVYTLLSQDPIIKYTKKCQYCRKSINEKEIMSSFTNAS